TVVDDVSHGDPSEKALLGAINKRPELIWKLQRAANNPSESPCRADGLSLKNARVFDVVTSVKHSMDTILSKLENRRRIKTNSARPHRTRGHARASHHPGFRRSPSYPGERSSDAPRGGWRFTPHCRPSQNNHLPAYRSPSRHQAKPRHAGKGQHPHKIPGEIVSPEVRR